MSELSDARLGEIVGMYETCQWPRDTDAADAMRDLHDEVRRLRSDLEHARKSASEHVAGLLSRISRGNAMRDEYAVALAEVRESVTLRDVELAERLVAPGPKAAGVSASECQEISDTIIGLYDISHERPTDLVAKRDARVIRALADTISAAKSNGSEIKDIPSWLRGVAADCEKEGLLNTDAGGPMAEAADRVGAMAAEAEKTGS